MINKWKYSFMVASFLFSFSCIAGGGHEHKEDNLAHEQGSTKVSEDNKKDSEEHGDEHDEEVHLSQAAIEKAEIEVLTASSKDIVITKKVVGKIVPNANKTINIYPRYNGLIKSLTKQLGGKANQGELLSVIESNDTLQKYEVKAPFSGTIVKKFANIGEQVEIKEPIYQLSNLSTVWCDLSIYRKDARHIKKGQNVLVKDGKVSDKSVISYVSPLGIEHNQTMLARVVLQNHSNQWLPGMYVEVYVDVSRKKVPVAVNQKAVHELEGNRVVFMRTKEGFKAVPCDVGLVGHDYAEVSGCLKPGQKYAANNSYLLKAHLGKEGASHEH